MASKIKSFLLRILRKFTELIRHPIWFIVKNTLFRCFKLTVEGKEHIPSGACVLAANHTSHWDSAVLFMASGRRQGEIFVLGARDSFFSTPFRSYIFGEVLGGMAIERPDEKDKSRKFDRALYREDIYGGISQLEQKKLLVVFPEGGRSGDGKLGEFKDVATVLAKRANCPIVPVYIQGTYQVWPPQSPWPRFRRRRFWVRIGAPLKPDTKVDDLRKQIEALRKSGNERAAFFDIDGTLTQTKVTDYYKWMIMRNLSPRQKAICHVFIILWGLIYLAVNYVSRSLFQRMFYRKYRGKSAADLEAIKSLVFNEITLRRLFKEAEQEIQQHLSEGTRVVFVTGTLPYIAFPLAEHLGVRDVRCTILRERDEKYTGALAGPPISDEHRATILRHFAWENGIDLQSSFAYGDSISDCQMLEVVGHPVAVNPDSKLRREALRQGWQIREWHL